MKVWTLGLAAILLALLPSDGSSAPISVDDTRHKRWSVTIGGSRGGGRGGGGGGRRRGKRADDTASENAEVVPMSLDESASLDDLEVPADRFKRSLEDMSDDGSRQKRWSFTIGSGGGGGGRGGGGRGRGGGRRRGKRADDIGSEDAEVNPMNLDESASLEDLEVPSDRFKRSLEDMSDEESRQKRWSIGISGSRGGGGGGGRGRGGGRRRGKRADDIGSEDVEVNPMSLDESASLEDLEVPADRFKRSLEDMSDKGSRQKRWSVTMSGSRGGGRGGGGRGGRGGGRGKRADDLENDTAPVLMHPLMQK